MERVKSVVKEIAYENTSKLNVLHKSLIPFLSLASSLYNLSLSLRHFLYHFRLFPSHRLPVPVISVGNLTWGGNGKTPMVEFIAIWLSHSGISPLILTRGYAGGDEAKMLQRHLLGTSSKIGVGANRAAVAASFFQRYGYKNCCSSGEGLKKLFVDQKVRRNLDSDRIGVIILDDGMQHLSLQRDLEVVMINGMMPWGNLQLLPLGPLREPLTALSRADVAVVHHADLVIDQDLKDIESMIRKANQNLPIFFTKMEPSHFFKVGNYSDIPLSAVCNMIVLCVSAIGFADPFVRAIQKIGPYYVDRLDFNDHQLFKAKDNELIRTRLGKLHDKFGSKPIVVVTEKDYDRDPETLGELDPYVVLVLCSHIQIVAHGGSTEETFKKKLKQLFDRPVDVSN